MQSDSKLIYFQKAINNRLKVILPAATTEPELLHQAMLYSALAPGKRLRAILSMASVESLGKDPLSALDAGCAIELVHCFSLIHDDLPAIDNDDLRRGQPTCHKVFGEAVAILAGDALFSLAFETLGRMDVSAEQVRDSLLELTQATSSLGLVGGEVLDILSEGKPCDLELLQKIHHKKTGVLFAASCAIGAIIAGASKDQVQNLRTYGASLGLAFQIADDILNETSTEQQLGKGVGTDKERGKATYPSLVGLEQSKWLAQDAVNTALESIECLPGDTSLLKQLAQFSVSRES